MAASRSVALAVFFVAAALLILPTKATSTIAASFLGHIVSFVGGALCMHACRYYIFNEPLIVTGKEEEWGHEWSAPPAAAQHRLSGYSKMVLLVRTDLGMGKGKIGAQCGHAAVAAYRQITKHSKDNAHLQQILAQWQDRGQTKISCRVDSEEEATFLCNQARAAGIVATPIHDAGRTQIASGSMTVVAIGPGDAAEVDRITGHLRLL